MPGDGAEEAEQSATREAVVVDLTGHGLARRLVLSRARKLVDRLARDGDGSRVAILCRSLGRQVYVARDDAEHVREYGVGELLTPAMQEEIRRDVFEITDRLVRGPWAHLFPSHRGIHLGELNLLRFRADLIDHAYFAAAARALSLEKSLLGTRVLGCSPEVVDLIERQLRAYGLDEIDTWSPRLLVRSGRLTQRFVTGARDKASSVARRFSRGNQRSDSGVGRPHDLPSGVNVLLVSETSSVDEMFDAVRPHLSPGPGQTVMTLHLDGQTGLERAADGDWRLHLQEPDDLPGKEVEERGAPSRKSSADRSAVPDREERAIVHRVGESRYVRDMVRSLYRKDFFNRQAHHIERAEELLERLSPELVVLGNGRWWIGQTFARLARRRDIPSLAIQHGVVADPIEWCWIETDHMAVNGPYLGELLTDYGVSRDRWTVTGQPRYDPLAELGTATVRQSLRRQLDVTDGSVFVLLPSEPEQDPAYVRETLRACLAVPGVQVGLRPHPLESDELHRRLASEDPDRVTVCRSEGILDLIAASDGLVVEDSTVALEGALLGRPVLATNFEKGIVPHHMRVCARSIADEPEELTAALGSLTPRSSSEEEDLDRGADSSELPDELREIVGPVDGHAGERVAGLIEECRSGDVVRPKNASARP